MYKIYRLRYRTTDVYLYYRYIVYLTECRGDTDRDTAPQRYRSNTECKKDTDRYTEPQIYIYYRWCILQNVEEIQIEIQNHKDTDRDTEPQRYR